MMGINEICELHKHGRECDFEWYLNKHSKEIFEADEQGYFKGLEFVSSQLFEDVRICGCDDKQTVILYKCVDSDGYYISITLSFDGKVMYRRKIMNVFKNAKFGEKFLTSKGDVVIYHKCLQRPDNLAHIDNGMSVHRVMSSENVYEVYDNGTYVNVSGSSYDVVSRLDDDEMDIVKTYVKKELCDEGNGEYTEGFLDGYKCGVIG